MQHTMEGIVLRQYKAGEDRILHILTARQGVLTAYANKSAAPRSPLAASTELLCYCCFVLFHNRDRCIVDKADTLRIFFGVRQDMEKLALASYMAQLADELCPHGVEAAEHLRLLLNTLHYIEKEKRPRPHLKALFELRLLTLSGFMPNLVGCRVCGCYEAPVMRFLPRSGELLCAGCQDAAGEQGMPAGPGVLAAMRHIIYAPLDKLFAFRLSDEGLGALQYIAETYLKCQVERTFSALEFYTSLQGPGAL